MLTMSDVDLTQKRVLIREDLNVPIHDGKITDDSRIQCALPTIKKALEQNAAVMVMSHFGRPKEGEYDEAFSLLPVANALSDALGCDVKLVKDWLNGVDVAPGDVVLCENVRFHAGEKSNLTALAKKMADLCDVFVMDAFATAHREQASTVGIAEHAPIACAGPLLVRELDALTKAFDDPARPMVAIVGGSKVSTKIQLLDRLLEKVDVLLVGGGIANTLLAAKGYPMGKSLYEADWVDNCVELLKKAEQAGVNIPLPRDVAVANEFSAKAPRKICDVNQVGDDELILDVGPETIATYPDLMASAKTIVWNGPVGVFEFAHFADGTRALGEAIVNSGAYSVAGGGDTVAAIHQFGFQDRMSYISTGGGAFLEFLQGDILPAVEALSKRS